MRQIKIEMGDSYKLGMNEVVGLKAALTEVFEPVRDVLRNKAYWEDELQPNDLEYKSRDGFIAHSHNCGGLELSLHVPECESSNWSCLEFGEHDENCCSDSGCNNDGELDAYLRIILKFEGINADGEMEFYINASGGNNDAPYFRVSELPDLFEASFTAKSVAGIKRAASKHIKALIKEVQGE